ncbi:sugar O-acetyltransferase [Lacticaseibacillus parakribbianus]|uniref:sugar O-acetyltransferase n=1 Tax=Lacticaseibacillus parakribbianus TaxID=2970927 RepID=UPI0021CB6F32|nr:sugar O-acetyltransferase [Lacticaseibacillus parakribbianus]
MTKSEKEKSFAGELYQPNDAALTAERAETTRRLYDYNHLHPLQKAERTAALRGLLGHVGANCVIEQPLFTTYGTNTVVGDNFFMNVNGRLMDSGKITIGDNVFIAPDVALITETHSQNVPERIQGLEYTHPITIEDNVWLCTGVKVLPGVTIGRNTVIGAGSVVTKDVPANVMAAGVPCKVIRAVAPEDRA